MIANMCGRFVLLAAGRELADAFDVSDAPLFGRYNIAPSQSAPVVLQADAGRCLRSMRWGLIPSWAKDPAVGFKSINARSETVADREAIRISGQDQPRPVKKR
jgi:putative SOS response-associated peptidase YedK